MLKALIAPYKHLGIKFMPTGAQLYGDLAMGSGSSLNITVDSNPSKNAIIALASDGAGIFTLSSGVDLSITVSPSTQTGWYVLLAGNDLSELSGVDFNTLFDVQGLAGSGLEANFELDLGKTDTLTLVLSEATGTPAPDLLSGVSSFSGIDGQSAASAVVDSAAAAAADTLKNAFLA